jgi:Zn-dependent M28 family amino/carboxypeptidase
MSLIASIMLMAAANLKEHVVMLSHKIGDRNIVAYEKLTKAADYITGQFEKYGYKVEFQTYEVDGKPVKNIIATKLGTKKPKEQIIVGAHYDTCANPGADDNASAVAGLLELARLMTDQPTGRTIKFIAFVNEEPPFFKTKNMGSMVYAQQAKARGDNIKAVIILEMIGYYSDKPNSQKYPPFFGRFYPDKGNFIAVVGNFASKPLVKKITNLFQQSSSFPIESIATFTFIPGIDWSDHWSFWQYGYPAIMITDTGFYRNPNYHKQSDTYETLNYENIAEVVVGLQGVLTKLATLFT